MCWEFAKGSRLQKFCVDRLLLLSMTFQVNTKNWATFLPQIISVYYLRHCSGRYFYNSVKQAKIKQKKPHKASHYVHKLLYIQSIQNTGYGRALVYLASTSGCVLWVCKEGTGGAAVVTCLMKSLIPGGGCFQEKIKNTFHKKMLGNLQPICSPICFSIRWGLV